MAPDPVAPNPFAPNPFAMHLPYEHVSLREGLRRGRSHLLFLAALAVVMALIVALDGIAPPPSPRPGHTDTRAADPPGRSMPGRGTLAPPARVPRDSAAPAPIPVLP